MSTRWLSNRPLGSALVLVWTFVAAGNSPSHAATLFATWSDVNNGVLDGVDFTVSASNGLFGINSANLSGPSYNPPGSSSQTALFYAAFTDLTITFESPVPDLLLYASFWRGTGSGANPALYDFSATPTILSGLTITTLTGNQLALPSSDFSSGILSFAASITSLTITSNAVSGSLQALTLAVIQPLNSVPEPGALILVGVLAAGAAVWMARRRRAAHA